jgi:hypothetical protein
MTYLYVVSFIVTSLMFQRACGRASCDFQNNLEMNGQAGSETSAFHEVSHRKQLHRDQDSHCGNLFRATSLACPAETGHYGPHPRRRVPSLNWRPLTGKLISRQVRNACTKLCSIPNSLAGSVQCPPKLVGAQMVPSRCSTVTLSAETRSSCEISELLRPGASWIGRRECIRS